MSIPNCGFITNSYSNKDLVDVFPVTQFYYFNLTGHDKNIIKTQSIIPPLTYSGTNYAVFSSVYYGYTGTSGTYSALETSEVLHTIVISDIQNTQFTWNLIKSSGNNVNIFIIFMVVWNSSLDYPKSYL